MESRSIFNKFLRVRGVYLVGKENLVTDRPCSGPALKLRVPGLTLQSAHRPHLVCPTCDWDPRPRPSPGRRPAPRRGEPKQQRPAPTPGRANQALQSQTSGYARRRVGRGGTGSRLGLLAPGSRLCSAASASSEAVQDAVPRAPLPGPPCRASLGTRAVDCRVCHPPPSRPGRAAARAARSCTVSASSCRGCSASWPSAR